MEPSLLIDMQNLLVALALAAPRIFVCIAILPGFGTNTLTGVARNGISFAISLPAVLPTFRFVQETQPDFLLAGMLAVKEALLGAIFGVMLSIPMWSVQSVGSILDTQRSPIQIQAGSASLDRDASAVGALLVQALVLLMIQAGMFAALVRILIESYALWPAFSLAPPFELGQMSVITARFGEFFWHIIVYGAPVIIPLMLIDFSFAIIGVFAPNLQVSFVSSPIKSLVGLFILLVYWPTLSHYILGDFAHLLDFLPSLLQAGPKP